MDAEEVVAIINNLPDRLDSEQMCVLILSIIGAYNYTGEQAASVLGDCITIYVGSLEERNRTRLH